MLFQFLSLSSSGGGISLWIGALQVINQKATQPTTLGFGHVSLFSVFSNTDSNLVLVSVPAVVRMPLLI
jgi:hypothetical protein